MGSTTSKPTDPGGNTLEIGQAYETLKNIIRIVYFDGVTYKADVIVNLGFGDYRVGESFTFSAGSSRHVNCKPATGYLNREKTKKALGV